MSKDDYETIGPSDPEQDKNFAKLERYIKICSAGAFIFLVIYFSWLLYKGGF